MCSRRFAIVTVVCIATASILLPTSVEARSKVSAIKGKIYRIDKRHGPWMIMVTNLHGNTEEARKNAAEAANELVYELRNRRVPVPAYVYTQTGRLESVELYDRLRRRQKRAYASQRNQIAIMAGNYSSIDPGTKEGKIAQDTLAWIKRYRPKSLDGGYFKPTPGKPNPFSRAMLVPNPLLTPEELQQKKDSKLLKSLNHGAEFSLAENTGKFTLTVASFHGNSISVRDTRMELESNKVSAFDQNIKEKRNLDNAALNAFQLVQLMRSRNIEAYLWHDRYKSIVTVGSFESAKDPRIRNFAAKFRAKKREHNGRIVLIAESIQSQRDPRNPNKSPAMNFPMDPEPRLITVPQL